ncbi:MAG: anthranilate synthase component I [Terriglobales bacterium]
MVRTLPADQLTPVSAFLSLSAGEPYAFLLESVEGGEKIGRYTFLGVRPFLILRAKGREITLERGKRRERRSGSLFPVLRELLRRHRPADVPGLPPFTAGAVGFLAYDAVRQLERLPARAQDDLKSPDCILMFFDRVLAFDHVQHQVHLMAAADVAREGPRRAYDRAQADLAAIEKKLAVAPGAAKAGKKPRGAIRMRSATSEPRFLASVRRIKEYIAAGDVFQTVLSQRLDFEPGVEAFDLYRALRRVNPSPYLYFLRMGEMQVLGSSPERLVKVTGERLEYRPIAGTRPRGRDEPEELRREEELRSSEKERAEHVMLVDLGRSDLGRVSEYGSVQVRELMKVERYSHVMHLVSSIEGKLHPGLDALDALAACFPAGTLTGAPKVRAMEIIEELEPVRRGVYGGAVLYADFAGNLDSCIAIRTMLMKGKRAYVQAGAGIVADSDPKAEFEECRSKAQALLRAAELARSGL